MNDSNTITSEELNPESQRLSRVLHVIVGHGLPTYFFNAISSVRTSAPDDEVLVVDNATNDREFVLRLQELCDGDDKIELVLRSSNDLSRNRKVGGLYDAYRFAFDRARQRGFDLVHLIQADMQLLWWDADVVRTADQLFDTYPNCVNIYTVLLSKDKLLTDELLQPQVGGQIALRRYGLTDTGLYHLQRWKDMEMFFSDRESVHGRLALERGLIVVCHPWPTVAPIPWPAVMRGGERHGVEVSANRPFLLKPLKPEQAAMLKRSDNPYWLEDVCIPWGWTCAVPMWPTEVNSVDYWVLRYRAMKRTHRLAMLLPRFERRGLTRLQRLLPAPLITHRPSLLRLFVIVPALEIWRRLEAAPSKHLPPGRHDRRLLVTDPAALSVEDSFG